MTHPQLVDRAERWLKSIGCSVKYFAGVEYANAKPPPFKACLKSEKAMLISAVRKLSLKQEEV